MSKKLSTEEFVQKAKLIHGERYEYSKVVYQTAHNKVIIACKVHGDFEQKANGHLTGKGCLKCSGKEQLDTDSFVKKAIIIHGNKYDYSLVDYRNITTKIQIICNVHGSFFQLPSNHLNGSSCPDCSSKKKHTTKSFIEKSKKIHGSRYDYSLVDYKNKQTKVKIICNIHGIFEQTPNNHFNSIIGCEKCKLDSTQSKSVSDIENILIFNRIKFIKEYRFENCRNTYSLPFDFFIEELNLCIEYDGIQHFKPVEHWGGEEGYNKTHINDKIKNEYCADNHINLLRISYNEEHKMVLKEYFKSKFNIILKE